MVSPTRRPVALAIRNEHLLGDRIFDLPPAGGELSPYVPWRYVKEHAAAAGLDVMTADQVAERGIDPCTVLLLAYDWIPLAKQLVAAGARPAVLTTLEPPVIAWQFYLGLRHISRRFPHAFVFPGAAHRLHPACTYHPLRYPQVRTGPPERMLPWAERKLLVMVNSNKALARVTSLERWFDRPREVSLKRAAATLLYPPIGRDLYLERLIAMGALGTRAGFDAFGQGWQQRHPAVPARLHAAAVRGLRGPLVDKQAALGQYRFALCLENSRFPGYVSEKLFDPLFAGCIPVYLGAPDVARYLPPDTFVDLSRFGGYRELWDYLAHMPATEGQRYLEAARAFLDSPAFEQFSVQHFANNVVDGLRDVAERYPR